MALVQFKTGASALATVAWGFDAATTAGNLIVGVFSADDYNGTPDSGWTQSSEMEQQGTHGSYLWWRISTGETNPQAYTIGSATNSAWLLAEFSLIDGTPYDGSQGLIDNSAGTTFATDNLTPTAGDRLLVAAINGCRISDTLNGDTVGSWTNSFTGIGSVGSGGSGTNNIVGVAYREVIADGLTAYSTGATYSETMSSRSGLIIAFKVGASTTDATGLPTGGGVTASAGVALAFGTPPPPYTLTRVTG